MNSKYASPTCVCLIAFGLLLAAITASAQEPSIVINEILASNGQSFLDADGDPSDWIELHNQSSSEINLAGWHLTDQPDDPKRWAIPPRVIPAGGYLVVFASGKDITSPFATNFHTNFSLSSDGEFLALYDSAGDLVDSFDPTFPKLASDVSYGRWEEAYRYFSPPSPGTANTGPSEGLLEEVQFSRTRGFVDEAFELTLSSDTPETTIRYTLNGTAPSLFNGIVYTEPITIDKTTTLLATSHKNGWIRSNPVTHTYLFVDDVIEQDVMASQITEHPEYGPLMRDALLAQPSISIVAAVGQNISDAIENPISLEFIHPDGSDGFQINCGIKRVGGHSLNSYPKNNLRLYFKSAYGAGKLRYPLFENHPYTSESAEEFDQLQLRSGSHDSVFYLGANQQLPSNAQYIRNRWMNDMQFLMGHESLRGRWVHVYLNGTYWGHYQLMERTTRSYFASYLGGEESDYMATNRGEPVGDSNMQPWNEMRASITNFNEFARRVDLENYVDYMLLNYYAGNDWDWNPEQNWAGGGPLDPEQGGMKFISWDSDIIFRNLNDNNLAKGGPHSMFHTLMNHAEFKVYVGDRFQKLFFDDGLLTPEKIKEVYNVRAEQIRLSIVAETARWGNGSWTRNQQWQTELNRLNDQFFPQRTQIVIDQFRTRGWLPHLQTPGIDPKGGTIEPASLVKLTKTIFAVGSIYYTTDGSDPRLPGGVISPSAMLYTAPIPLSVTATLKTRIYNNEEWSALNEASFFVGGRPAGPGDLLVSKINYHPAAASIEEELSGYGRGDFEFIELTNVADTAIELNALRFSSGIQFDFSSTSPARLEVGAKSFLASNRAAFEMRYGNGYPVLGEYGGSLANEGESLHIESDTSILNFRYGAESPWLTEAGGTGAYLVLKDPYAASDPSDSSSWRLSHSADLPPFGTAPDPDAGYLTWVESAIPDPEMRVPTADPDGDGWSNLLEYLFNSEPTHSNSTPSISISGHLEEDRVIANYAIPFRPGVSGHEITVESSPDMVEWLPLTEDSIVEIEKQTDSQTFHLNLSKDSHSFLRLKISPSS